MVCWLFIQLDLMHVIVVTLLQFLHHSCCNRMQILPFKFGIILTLVVNAISHY